MGNNLKVRIGMSWYKMGVWKLKNIRKNFEANKCPLCLEQENEIHIILECKSTEELRERWIENRLVGGNRKLIVQKLLNSNNEKTRNNLGKFLYSVRNMWVKEIEGLSKSIEKD